MHFDVRLSGDFRDLTRAELASGKRAVRDAMAQAGTSLKMAWRSEVVAVGLGNRLGNSIRSKVFPATGPGSLRAAALVYTKAPKLIEAHDKGAVIRSKDGFWLAIPLPPAGRTKNRKMTPAIWEKKTGRLLQFVYDGGRHAFLVDTGKKGIGNVMVRRRVRGQYQLAEPRTYKKRYVPMFLLVPQAKLKKKGDVATLANATASRLPRMIAANWRDR